MLSKNRLKLANRQRPLTSVQAWERFELALRNIYSLEEAAEWLRSNPHIASKLTGAGLLATFEKEAKKIVDSL